MILLLLSYVAGVLTIVSPCILPVLPFVFARADQSFLRSGLPMLAGMALTFAAIATLASVGGSWAVAANQYGRYAAMALLALFGVSLLSDSLAERAARPLVALGHRLSLVADAHSARGQVVASVLLGVATGLLWAPCAGPILGLILTGAAISGGNANTTLLLFAYAAGAATSLAAALLIGGRVFAAMKRSLGAGEWIRRGLGVAVLVGVAAVALGLDTGILTRLSLASTEGLEQQLLQKTLPVVGAAPVTEGVLPVEGSLPSLAGAVLWLNSPPLSAEQLRGKVVLVDFWTYSCINCLRSLPYLRAWASKYQSYGLVVIGVHSPEFAFEKDPTQVRRAVRDLGITYPVALDNDFAIWRAFNNGYWPAHYFIDAQGRVRHHHFGEGSYDESERVIQALLAEAGTHDVPMGLVDPRADGAEASAPQQATQSPETYVGYARSTDFVSGAPVKDTTSTYATPQTLERNQWGLAGAWRIEAERAVLENASGKMVFRFRARDLHLVLGCAPDGKPVRFRITLDGRPPGADHGADSDAEGNGSVTEQRLYQLVRAQGALADRTFEIEFLDPGVAAYAFTFG